jgi:beta-glucosidase
MIIPVPELPSGNMDEMYEQQITELISKMTIEEKVGQMTQLNIDVVCVGEVYNLQEPHRIDSAKLHKAIVENHVGSILNCGGHAYPLAQWHEMIGNIQRVATQKTRLKIPVLYGIDAIHGTNYVIGSTLFPQPLAQAATFNTELVRNGAGITAYETRAAGIPWNFSPVLDVARHPAWSRVFETYGEDTYLCTEMGGAVINGYQGIGGPESGPDKYHVAACMKHFLGYSGARTGKDRTPAYIPNNQLREIYLPPFQEAVRRGALTVMINSGEINGVPVHANYDILTTLLRDELKFQGIAVTDWEDVMKLHLNHKTASSLKEATYQAVQAGIDMCMVPNDYNFTNHLIELVKEGRISEERLDKSVRRILWVKQKLRLNSGPIVPSAKDYKLFGSPDFHKAALKTAEESITLLENRNSALPLGKQDKIFVTGPAANSMILLNGAWSRTWQGTDEKWDDTTKFTIYEALKANNPNVQYALGCDILDKPVSDNAMQLASESDVIIVCLGEYPATEKVGDIDDLSFSRTQLDYVKALASLRKKLILVLVENRPRLVNEIADMASAVVMAYQPGDFGGEALANILYGDVNPSGRLPITYPRFNQSMLTYDHKYTETLDQKFANTAFNPQWEFGHGLSYSNVLYSDLKVASPEVVQNGLVNVTVTLQNPSDRSVKESVLLFIRDHYASVTPSVKKLRQFQKIELQPRETKTVTFVLKASDLKLCDRNGQWIYENGDFDIIIGKLKTTLTLK